MLRATAHQQRNPGFTLRVRSRVNSYVTYISKIFCVEDLPGKTFASGVLHWLYQKCPKLQSHLVLKTIRGKCLIFYFQIFF